jgi:hypothetical protein
MTQDGKDWGHSNPRRAVKVSVQVQTPAAYFQGIKHTNQFNLLAPEFWI